MIPVNEYQTKITEELLNSLNDEVRTELLDIDEYWESLSKYE